MRAESRESMEIKRRKRYAMWPTPPKRKQATKKEITKELNRVLWHIGRFSGEAYAKMCMVRLMRAQVRSLRRQLERRDEKLRTVKR